MELADSDDIRIAKAQAFCIASHGALQQVRKYTGEPYHHHPFRVAELLKEQANFYTNEMLIAAYLHDVPEDVGMHMLSIIYREFGSVAGGYVSELTNPERDPARGNRAWRVKQNRIHIATSSPNSKTVKLADGVDNMRCLLKSDDDKFIPVYLKEKQDTFPHLKQGDPNLYAMYYELMNGRMV